VHSFAALGVGMSRLRPKIIGMNSLRRKHNGIARALFKRFRISLAGKPYFDDHKGKLPVQREFIIRFREDPGTLGARANGGR
jgi:hypothetical protein